MIVRSKSGNTTTIEAVLPTQKTTSKSIKVIAKTAVHDKFVHEHDFVIVQFDKKTSCLIRCVTCNVYFCQSCGQTHCSCVMKQVR
jgi:D-arabinose 5-phosphate isomerase GutQ